MQWISVWIVCQIHHLPMLYKYVKKEDIFFTKLVFSLSSQFLLRLQIEIVRKFRIVVLCKIMWEEQHTCKLR